eukprot:scaffold73879_cov69-Attheya_sp.AAC.2
MIHKGNPRLVIEAMKCYEDIGKGMIDTLKTAPYKGCNMKVLAECLAMMHSDPSKLLAHTPQIDQ